MIIFDENVDQELIDRFKNQGYEVFSIREHQPGISDREVIEKVKSSRGILITEDKDFGELMFAYNIKNCPVIFLRYGNSDKEQVTENIFHVLQNYYKSSEHFFITITGNRIRIRKM